MRATTTCSLQFKPSFSEYALLDEAGELLEAGKLRTTKSALWNRFAALSPTIVSVNYDPRFLWAVEMLTQMGHAILFSGAVPELLRDELVPAVGAVNGTALLCQAGRNSSPTIFFLVQADQGRVLDAHYLVGPVTSETTLSSLVSTIPQTVEAGSAQECANRLHQLVGSGVLVIPDAARMNGRAAVSAA